MTKQAMTSTATVTPRALTPYRLECAACAGDGRTGAGRCSECGGRGWVRVTEEEFRRHEAQRQQRIAQAWVEADRGL